MLEACPSCAAKVEFTANICPLCQADRENPEQSKAGGWKPNQKWSHSGNKQSEEGDDTEKQPNMRLRLGSLLLFGGWGIRRLADQTNHFNQSIGSSDSSGAGAALGLLMLISGLVSILAGLSKFIYK
ncbi:MAG: hypothetical protein JWM16_2568 [Verrucomicrobiales bacterium]|nr:hypothetical protein [Verrucomicrobiales bacterium]